MWNESRVLSWPLMFRRQYAQPIDVDSVFETLAEMNTYLSNSLRHIGQIATCQETEGIIYIMNNNMDAWVTVDTGSGNGILIFSTITELNTHLTNEDRKAGEIVTCNETEGIIYILNNLRDAWITIDIYSKLDSTEFYSHTGDTSIHFNKASINISEINSAHTHSISEVSDLQTELNSKLDLTGGTLTGTLNALNIIASDYSGITTSMVYNETSLSGETIQDIFEDSIATEATTILLDDLLVGGRIEDINGVNTQVNKYWSWELLKDDIITNIPTDLTALNAHTGDTSIHYTKDSINISDINSAHTHSISDVSDLQTSLNSKLNLTGGTLSGDLIGTTISATTYQGITSDMVINLSTLSGDTITEVLNVSEAVEVMGLLSGDMITLARMNGAVSENFMIDADNAKTFFETDLSLLYSHTGDTSIHYTKESINISDINSAHTHTITDVTDLQNDLNSKTDLSLFNSHTATTNAHNVSFSDLITTAHTHAISDVTSLQTSLNSKLNLTGGTLTGALIGTTISASTYQGISSDMVINLSTLSGDTITEVLNVSESVEVTSLLSGDMISLSRLTGVTSQNIMIDIYNAKSFFETDLSLLYSHTGYTSIHYTKDSINFSDLGSTAHTHTVSDITDLNSIGTGMVFVKDSTEVNTALESEVNTISICIESGITMTTISNIYAEKTYITGQNIELTSGYFVPNSSSLSADIFIHFHSSVSMVHDDNESAIIFLITDGNWNLVFRDLNQTKPFLFNVLGGASLNIITEHDILIDEDNSTGTWTHTVNKNLDSTGFYSRTFSKQGKHKVRTEISDSGFFTATVLLELAHGDSGTTILMQQDNGILLHPNFVSLTYLDSIETGTTAIKPELYFPRFDGEVEPITIFGYNNAPMKGIRTLYKVSDGSNGWSYEEGNERAVILENGNWYFTYKTVNTVSTNTTFYNMVISGHADLYHSIL